MGISTTLIPFASGTNTNTVATNSSGATNRIVALGYGNSHSLNIRSLIQFELAAANIWYSFTLPQNGTIESIYGDISTIAAWMPTGNITPYIAIATASSGSNRFEIQTQTITPAFTAYEQGTNYPAYTARIASQTGLNIKSASATRIMIVGGIQANGGTLTQTLSFSFTGGVTIRWT
jgi:hypothetical protein